MVTARAPGSQAVPCPSLIAWPGSACPACGDLLLWTLDWYRFLLLFSLSGGDQSLSTFPECILLGAVTLGCMDHKPAGPGSPLSSEGVTHSTQLPTAPGASLPGKWLQSFGAPVFLDFKTALVSGQLSSPRPAPAEDPANKTAPHLSCGRTPLHTHRCIYTTPWTIPQVNLLPPLRG